MNVCTPTRTAAAQRLAAAVRQHLETAGFQVLRGNQDAPLGVASATVRANEYREGDVVVQVLGDHAEFLRAREVLGTKWQVRYDRLGHVWLVF